METIEEQILESLERIRPFIKRDGGDIKFLRYEDGIVYIQFLGACVDCSISNVTLKEGVEAILLEEVPGVLCVEEGK